MLEGLEVKEVMFSIPLNDEILRLESEFYTAQTFELKKFTSGKEIIDFVQYGTSEELNEDFEGYPILRLNEFNSSFIGKPSKYCRIIDKTSFENLKLLKDDVLICRTNGNPKYVGKSALVPSNYEFAYASYLFKIRPKKEIINSSTLVAYLNSLYGRMEIEKFSMTSNQSNFSPAKFRELRIPVFSKNLNELIEKIYYSSYDLLLQSQEKYTQAEGKLLLEVGLAVRDNETMQWINEMVTDYVKPTTIEDILSNESKTQPDVFERTQFLLEEIKRLSLPENYSPNNMDTVDKMMEEINQLEKERNSSQKFHKDILSIMKQHNKNAENIKSIHEAQKQNVNIKNFKESFGTTGRLDAEYYQPKYEVITNAIKTYKNGYSTLETFIENYSTGFPYKSETYSDIEGIPLIRINNISKGNLDLSKAINIPFQDLDLSIKDIANENDILISMSGTIGNSCKIRKGVKAVVNQRIMRITPKSYNVDVLPLVINSIIGQSQLERIGTGGVQTNISAMDIKEILIPIIDSKKQEEIAELVEESFKLKVESERLLEVAKRAVEMAIEIDEATAIKFIKDNTK